MKIRYDQRYTTLKEVYRVGNYTAAGNVLGLTPSAVAQQIHGIERELNVTLFAKGNKGLVPTQECETVIQYVDKIESLCRRMGSDIENFRYGLKRLSVGVTPSAENFALSRVFTQYAEQHADTQIVMNTGSVEELVRALLNYEIDLAVIEGNYVGDALNTIMVDTDFLSVAVPPDSKYAKNGVIHLEELMSEPLILKCRGSGTRDLFEATLSVHGYSVQKLHVMMEADSISTIKKLVANHYGLSVLSNKACMRDVAAGKICTVPLAGMSMIRNIQLLYRKDFRHEEMLRELQNVYAQIMRDPYDGAEDKKE